MVYTRCYSCPHIPLPMILLPYLSDEAAISMSSLQQVLQFVEVRNADERPRTLQDITVLDCFSKLAR